MVQVKDLTERPVADLWQEVKEEEEAWWQDISARALREVQTLLEGALEAELLEQLWAGRYKRTEMRRGYRNGSYYRSLSTPVGLIPQLRVPRAREGGPDRVHAESADHLECDGQTAEALGTR